MPEEITAESLMDSIAEKISDGVFHHKEKSDGFTARSKRLWGRERPLHHVLGGGKSADVLLWRNKKISASFLVSATIVWVLFEWLNYHFLTLVSFVVVLAMLAQFLWKRASDTLNRSPSSVPHVVLPEDVFVDIAKLIGSELNRGLGFLQDIACEGTAKQFLGVAAALFAAAIIGSWFNFLTLIYIGFVAAHTLPVLYENYDDQIDELVNNVLKQFTHNYRKLDASVLSRIPKPKFEGRKYK